MSALDNHQVSGQVDTKGQGAGRNKDWSILAQFYIIFTAEAALDLSQAKQHLMTVHSKESLFPNSMLCT